VLRPPSARTTRHEPLQRRYVRMIGARAQAARRRPHSGRCRHRSRAALQGGKERPSSGQGADRVARPRRRLRADWPGLAGTMRNVLPPSGSVSPGRQFGTALLSVGGSAGRPFFVSSLNRNAIWSPPPWDRTAGRAYRASLTFLPLRRRLVAACYSEEAAAPRTPGQAMKRAAAVSSRPKGGERCDGSRL
jgi:hypothetical protein